MQQSAADILIKAIYDEVPIVLVAGQSFGIPAQSHSVLTLYQSRIGNSSEAFTWHHVLASELEQGDLEFLSERFDRLVPSSDSLRSIDLPWSAVFTSSIDPRFARRFETRGRQPEAVMSRNHYARVSRSKSRPPINHLFGRLNEDTHDTQIPRTKIELALRKQMHTNDLLNRIADTATVHGLVVIDGVIPGCDWLDVEDLFAALLSQPGVRVLWFQAPTELTTVLSIAMQETGALAMTCDSLGSCVMMLEAEGRLELSEISAPDDPAQITISDGAINISPQLRLRVEASANIVDDSWTAQSEALDRAHRLEAFRLFHGDLGGIRNLIEGVERDFAIERNFEKTLWRDVEKAVKRLGNTDSLLILHGQSATGKSIALARLARQVRLKLRLPVIFCLDRLPNSDDIESFCAAAEDAGARTSVLICDANLPIHRYREITSALQSRGRNIITVGTTYRISDSSLHGQGFGVEAPVELSPDEIEALSSLIAREAPRESGEKSAPDGWNMLAYVYRKLSSGRARIAGAISAEARNTEILVRERARKVPQDTHRSKLAEQLVQIGLADRTTSIFDENSVAAEAGEDVAGRLVDLVMVAGRLNVPVPINLLMRVLSNKIRSLNFMAFSYLFEEIDLFRWPKTNPEDSDLVIRPRLQLEAELICRRRIANSEREIDYIVDLIRAVQFDGIEQSHERGFIIDLLQKLDREGPRGQAYRQGYLRFAEALRYLREERGILDASLILRECAFYRQAVFTSGGPSSAEEMTEQQQLQVLSAASRTIEDALRYGDAGKMKVGRHNKLRLHVERASIYGYIAVQRAKSGDSDTWSEYEAARQAGLKATALTDDYSPIDVALWTATDVLRYKTTNAQRGQLIADIYSTLDLAETINLRPEQKARYDWRREKVAGLLDDKALGEDALKSLNAIDPAAAAFLCARRVAPDRSKDDEPSEDLATRAAEAADLLENSADAMQDVRCLRFLVRMRWIAATGQWLFSGERGRTPSNANSVDQLLKLVGIQNEHLGDAVRNQDRFLEAVLRFLSRDVRRSTELWRDLSKDTEFEDRSRVIRKLIATGPDQRPINFKGRVDQRISDHRWLVKVDDFKSSISLLEHEFRSEQIAPGRQIHRLWIAFNYLGPIAEYPK